MRKRYTGSNPGGATDGDGNPDEVAFNLPRSESEVDAMNVADLVALGGKGGYLEKKNNSLLVYYMPACCGPKWKLRYFVLLGDFLYRFSDEGAPRPKGVPIPISAVSVQRLAHDANLEHVDEDGYSPEPFCFEIRALLKTYILKAANAAECAEWVKAIQARKLSSIREGLGHAPLHARVKALNVAAAALYDARIEREIQLGAESRRQAASALGRSMGDFGAADTLAGANGWTGEGQGMGTLNPMDIRPSHSPSPSSARK
jgi:hypothetical protein